MIKMIKKMLGWEQKVDYANLIKQGAIVLDVRTKKEYESGHINGSINIAVNLLTNHLSKLKDKNKPIITCCASGMRSGSAKQFLQSNGYTQVYNGGSWTSLQIKCK